MCLWKINNHWFHWHINLYQRQKRSKVRMYAHRYVRTDNILSFTKFDFEPHIRTVQRM